ncbi:MAG: isocitrate lyase/phosphoenolpyruvate mutase family protein, partial [Proteobacteria bacterium]|nr:isocitrate lyase/phosphoenolpyruvate mutase family protein [Pseudomonadota bacterium]
NVALAADTGIAGLSVEDSTGDPEHPLYDFDVAVRRIAAASDALKGTGVVLTARSEGFIRNRPDLDETIRRLTAFAEAGADCLYAPGLRDESQIATVVKAVAPLPVNVLAPGLPVATLAALGARRISVGGSLARTAWAGFLRAAREIATEGTFTAFADGAPGGELNKLFADAAERRA